MISLSFGGIPYHLSDKKASIYLQPLPFDGTSTWGKGADKGFTAFLEAANNMELYDIETDFKVFTKGIHILPPPPFFSSAEEMFSHTYSLTHKLLKTGKFLTFFGGEHSVSIGIIKAFYETYPKISVLQIDAHADLRPEYDGTPYNHACALHEANNNVPLVQVGIRSMDESEKKYMNESNVFFAHNLSDNPDWMEKAIHLLSDHVYITFDLDAFDSSLMPATGTPEPGGLFWNETLQFLKKVFDKKNVMGFDIVELAPIKDLKAPNYLAAKLYYKMLSYKFYKNK